MGATARPQSTLGSGGGAGCGSSTSSSNASYFLVRDKRDLHGSRCRGPSMDAFVQAADVGGDAGAAPATSRSPHESDDTGRRGALVLSTLTCSVGEDGMRRTPCPAEGRPPATAALVGSGSTGTHPRACRLDGRVPCVPRRPRRYSGAACPRPLNVARDAVEPLPAVQRARWSR